MTLFTDNHASTTPPTGPQDAVVQPSVDPIDAIDESQYETPEVPKGKPKLFNRLSMCLLFLLTLGGGFYGGVWMQKREAPAAAATGRTAATGANRAALAAAFAAAGGTGAGAGTGAGTGGGTGTGTGTGAAAGAGGTRGTIVLVDAPNHAIYIQDAQGNAIKVAVNASTVMKVSKTTTDPNDYTIGATVTVTGATDADGNITATAISEGTARGAGGFGGGGGGGFGGTGAGAGTGTGTGAGTATTVAKPAG